MNFNKKIYRVRGFFIESKPISDCITESTGKAPSDESYMEYIESVDSKTDFDSMKDARNFLKKITEKYY